MTARARGALPLLGLLAACRSDASGGPAGQDALRADSSVAGPAVDLAASTFDPGAVQPGDTVLGLTVESKSVERALADSIWIGEVVFTGDLVVQGVYQRHPDWPAVAEPCFHVTDPASIARVPRFPPDPYNADSRTWLCFSNADLAVQLLGDPEPPREAVVAVDHYHARYDVSEVWGTAELMEVVDVGATVAATLRGP